jgi:hypothetical protein
LLTAFPSNPDNAAWNLITAALIKIGTEEFTFPPLLHKGSIKPYKLMIAVPQFAELTIPEQAQYIWDNGDYLLTRKGERGTSVLYAVDNFFVEVWYDEEGSEITEIVSIDSFIRLDAYLKAVSLKGLFV